MLVTASWGGAEVALELDAECRSVAALKRCLQEALPEVDVEAVRLEVCGRSVDNESVIGLVDGSVIDVSATQAALAAATLREEGCAVDVSGFWRAARLAAVGYVRLCKLYLEAGVVWCGVVWPPGVETPRHLAAKGNHRELGMLLLEWGCGKRRKVQRGHNRSFQPYSPMGWRVALRSGRVHKLCQRLRSSGSRYARHRSHIRQLRRARTIRPCVWPCELVWRRAWSSKANKRKAHEAPWRPRRVHGYR